MPIPDIRPVYNCPWRDCRLANPPILAPRWRTATDPVLPPLCGNLGCRPPKTPVRTIGLGAMHSDLNASRNLARIGETAVSPKAAVNTPDVGSVDRGNHVCASQ